MRSRVLEKVAETPTPTPSIASASLSGLPPDLLQEASKRLGWAALIVAVLWGIAAAVLAVIGKRYFDRIKGLPRTQETVQEIPPTLNPSKETP